MFNVNVTDLRYIIFSLDMFVLEFVGNDPSTSSTCLMSVLLIFIVEMTKNFLHIDFMELIKTKMDEERSKESKIVCVCIEESMA